MEDGRMDPRQRLRRLWDTKNVRGALLRWDVIAREGKW